LFVERTVYIPARFEVSRVYRAIKFLVLVFWFLTPCNYVVEYPCFGRSCFLHLQDLRGRQVLRNLVSYITTRHHVPEDRDIFLLFHFTLIIIIIIIVVVVVVVVIRASRVSSAGIALGYLLDDRGSRVRFPAGAGNFSLHHRVQNGSETHRASYPVGTRGSFSGGKAAAA
jgi:hypothetical protein